MTETKIDAPNQAEFVRGILKRKLSRANVRVDSQKRPDWVQHGIDDALTEIKELEAQNERLLALAQRIARGRKEKDGLNGKPLAGERARQMARTILVELGKPW